MPSVTRRRLLGGAAALVAAAYGATHLDRTATDLASWTPAAGTWPLRRYDPANTAHNPDAAPPRESPSSREVGTAPSPGERPRCAPVVAPDHVAVFGTGFAVVHRGGGEPLRGRAAATPHAGFGPDGNLHVLHRDPDGVDAPSAVVGYGPDRREVYRVPLAADHPTGLLVGDGEVYVGTEAGDVHAVDPDAGRRWQVDGTAPALADGRLYAAGALDGVVAYAPRSGLGRHLRTGPERAWSAAPVGGFRHLPAVADGRLVVGTYAEGGGAAVAFDATTGERLWAPRPLGTDVSTPAVVGDRGYAAVANDDGGRVVALDLATGETVWRDAVEWAATAPVVAGDTLVVAGEADGGGRLRAYDRVTGDVLWSRALDGGPAVPALVGDRVFVTAGATLYALA